MSFNAGDIVSSLVLDRSPWQQGLDQARREAADFQKGGLSVKLDADTTGYTTKLDAAKKKADDLAKASGTVRFDADTAAFTAKVDQARQRADQLAKASGTVRFDADIAPLTAKAATAKAALDGVTAARSAKLDADIAALQVKITQARAELDQAAATRTARLDADASALEIKVAQAQGQLQTLQDAKASPKVDLDLAQLDIRKSQVEAELDELATRKATPEVALATEQAQINLAQIEARIDELNAKRANPRVDADIAAAEAKVASLTAELDAVNGKRANATADVDDAAAEAKIAQLEAQLEVLSARRAQITVTADTSQAEGALSGLSAQVVGVTALGAGIGGLGGSLLAMVPAAAAAGAGLGVFGLASQDVGKAVSATNDDTKAAGNSAQDAARKAQEAANKQASSASQIASAQDRLRQSYSNLSNVQASVADASARAAEQVSTAETAAGRAREQAAQQAQQAAEKTSEAEANAGRVRQQVAQQAAQSDEQIRAADERVATAKEQAERSVESALRSEQTAEQSLTNAVLSAQRAQESLTEARAAATRQLEDLNLQTQDGALAQRRAVLGVQEAQQTLNKTIADPTATNLARQQAQLAYDEAVQQVTDVSVKNKQLAQDKADADRRGVEGSKQVVTALDGVRSANQQVGNAQRAQADSVVAVQRAQSDGARSIADAQRALAQAQQSAVVQAQQGQYQIAQADRQVADAKRAQDQQARESAYSIAAADRQVADAKRAQDTQARQSAYQLAQAQQQIVEAHRAVENAQREATQAAVTGGAQSKAATDKVAEALNKLPPAARAFALELRSLKPITDDLQNTAAAGLFPGVERGIDAVLPKLADYRTDIGLVGSATGSAVAEVGRGMASDSWVGFINQFSLASTTIVPEFVDSLGTVVHGAADMVTALEPAAPAADRVLDSFGRLESNLAPFLPGTVTPLAGGFEYLIDNGLTPLGPLLQAAAPLATDLEHVLGDGLGGALTILGPALQGVDDVLHPFVVILDALPAPITGVITALTALSFTSKGVGGTLSAAWDLISPASTATRLDNAAAKVKNLGSTLAGVAAPAKSAASASDEADSAVTRAGNAAETAETKAKNLGAALGGVGAPARDAAAATEGVEGSTAKAAGAAENAEKGTSKFGNALRGIGSSLPLIGAVITGVAIAYDSLVTSTDDAVNAMNQGGVAAQQMDQKMAEQTGVKSILQGMGDLGSAIALFIPDSEDAAKAAQDQYNALSTLGQRQVDVTRAQGDYTAAVQQFGVSSPQAVTALNNLRDATQREADAQTAQRLNTDLATASILNQQNRILGSINAEAAKAQSQDAMRQSQDSYNKAVQQFGPNSDQAQSALATYNGSIASYLTNVQQAALAQAQANHSQNAGRDAATATNIATINLANTMKGPLPDALNQMISHMTATDAVVAGATLKVDSFGNEVAVLPNGKTIALDVNNQTATQRLQQTIDLVNAAHGHLTIDANGQPANDESRKLLGDINASWGTLHIAGDPGPGDGSLRALLDRVDAARRAMHIEGDPRPATTDTNQLLDWVNRQNAAIQARANTDPGQRDVNAFKDSVPKNPPPPIPVNVNTKPGDDSMKAWLVGLGAIPIFGPAFTFAASLMARGGLVRAATGGAISGPGSGTSDSIPAMLSNGEYVVNAASVSRVGVGALDAINRMAGGGPVGYAAGGGVDPLAGPGPSPAAGAGTGALGAAAGAQGAGVGAIAGAAPGGAPGGAAQPAAAAGAAGPAGAAAPGGPGGAATGGLPYTPAQAAAVTVATQGLTAAMTTQAAVLTGVLNPALAANASATGVHTAAAAGMATTNTGTVVPSLMAVAAAEYGQAIPANQATAASHQQLVAAGLMPLVTAITGQVVPTFGAYRADQGVTQASTTATQVNTAVNTGLMTGQVTGMSLAAQAQHAGLRAGLVATQVENGNTATNTAVNSQNMLTSMTSMSVLGQGQHANLRAGQAATRVDTDATANNFAVNNSNITNSTTGMSLAVQGQHTALRAAQQATGGATVAFADGWQAQMGRVVPDSANPVRWVMQFPMTGIVNAWNNLDGQFALGKHVNPVPPNFAAGGQFRSSYAAGGLHHTGDGAVSGPGTGTSDEVNARLSDGEFVVRESVARPHLGFLQALNGGQPEALLAAGRPGVPAFAGGGIMAAQAQAQQAAGKPYIWGAVGPAGYDCCIIGDVRVYGTFGAKPISEIQPGDMVYSFEEGKQTANRVNAAWKSKTQEVFKVRTRNRAITASANHPFLRLVKSPERVVHQEDAEWPGLLPLGTSRNAPCTVSTCTKTNKARGLCTKHYPAWRTHGDPRLFATTAIRYVTEWARLDELNRDDLLIAPRAMRPEPTVDPTLHDGTSIDNDVAWLIGLAVGDGHLTPKDTRICVYGATRERVEDVVVKRWAARTNWTEKAGIIVSARGLHDGLARLGMMVPGLWKRVPAAVWAWPEAQQRAFLDGYCDADGHCPADTKRHGQRTYSSASRELVEDVRALHIMLGDDASNISTHERTKPIVIKGKTVKNAQPLHTFAIWNGARHGAAKTVSQHHGVGEWLAENPDFTVLNVLGIEAQGVQDTYDLNVDGAHNFIADGVVVHNSGLVSSIVNAFDGRNPYSRRGTTGTMPWPGFVNGLNGPLTAGWNSHHMASTTLGVNNEARETGTPVYYGGPAVGADSSEFTGHATYAPAGFGGFKSGGAGSGGGGLSFDPTPIVNGAFAPVYKAITDFPNFFGTSPQASRDIGVAKVGADMVKQKAMDQLMSMMSGGASIGPMSASHTLDIINAAKSKGVPHAGAVIAVMTGLQESGLRILANPSVPASMALPHEGVGNDHDSVGIFQQRQSWGPTPLLMNPFGSAQLFFNKLGRGPYGAYGGEAQRVQVSAFPGAYSKWQGQAEGLVRSQGFDIGGIVPPGNSMVRNWTGSNEHVGILTDDQWQSLRGLSNRAQRGETGTGAGGSLDGLSTEQISDAVEAGMRRALEGAELAGHVTTDTGAMDARIRMATSALARSIQTGVNR